MQKQLILSAQTDICKADWFHQVIQELILTNYKEKDLMLKQLHQIQLQDRDCLHIQSLYTLYAFFIEFKEIFTQNSQQNRMNFSQMSNNPLGISQLKSTTGNDLYGSRIVTQSHSLPPISQPILTKYRANKSSQNKLIIQETSSFWCKLFNTKPSFSIALCKCQRTQQGHCQLVMKWINDYYDWKKDSRFAKAYRSYSRRNIELFLSDSDIRRRLQKKLQILGIKLSEKYIAMLLRISRNFLKHTIYYGKSEAQTRENDLWMWFLIGIFYHIGANPQTEETNLEEEIMFWSLDIIMNHFGNLNRNEFYQHIKKIIELIREYFAKSYEKLIFQYHIDLEPIIYEWTNQFMMGYMEIDSIAFFIDCLLKKGWTYVYKIVLSYFQKRLEKMENDELFQTVNDKQVIMRQLLNCNEEWPLIFCNANTFCLEKQQSSQPH